MQNSLQIPREGYTDSLKVLTHDILSTSYSSLREVEQCHVEKMFPLTSTLILTRSRVQKRTARP